MAPNSVLKRYNLLAGENTFSSPACVNDSDARKLQSLIPSLAGYLEREHQLIVVPTGMSPLPARVGFFHQYKQNAAGVVTSFFFCATATTLFSLVANVWTPVTAVGTLAGFPAAVNINNQMHLSDGVSNFIFDGISWVVAGLPIPQHKPVFVPITPSTPVNIVSVSRVNGVTTVTYGPGLVGNGIYLTFVGVSDPSVNGEFPVTFLTSNSASFAQPGQPDITIGVGGTVQPSNFTVLSNRYYWTTFFDSTLTHQHESSSSPISVGTGALSGKAVRVQQRPGFISSVSGTSVVGAGTDFDQSDVGMLLYYLPVGANVQALVIQSVQDTQHLTLATAGLTPFGNGFYVIAPARATHWNVYASSSEEDKIGNLLASVQITDGIAVINSAYFDQSPMIGVIGSYFSGVQRPTLNDPPNASKILEVHANRVWRRLEDRQNFFTYTGNEEILAEQAGAPAESVPGAAGKLTISADALNETSLPDQAIHIRGARKHGEALYFGSELNIIPLYGKNLQTFDLSENVAFAVGLSGSRGWCSTPFGLAFISYDKKVYLYPSQYSFGVDSTTALVELGRPKRPEFEQMTDLENVFLVFYNWGRRNWLIATYQRKDTTFASWAFDFEVKGWFQLQQPYTALYVFEFATGEKSLIGAGTDNRIYCIDDLTAEFVPDPNANFPVGYFRQLVDFGDPNSTFLIQGIGLEKSRKDLEVAVTVWLDPVDPENPSDSVPAIPVALSQTKIGANSYIGYLTSDTGGACSRLLVEFALPPSTVNGRLHGFTIIGNKIPAPVLGAPSETQ